MEEIQRKRIAIFQGEAKIGEVIKGLSEIKLTPEDFSSPISLQMALSRIYSALMKSMEEGFKKHYIAEIRFRDNLGNLVSFAIDLGDTPPPFTSKNVKARIIIELYEEE